MTIGEPTMAMMMPKVHVTMIKGACSNDSKSTCGKMPQRNWATTPKKGAAATKSVILGLLILGTAYFFVPMEIKSPGLMLLFLVLTAITFSLFGFLIGIWANGFEQLQIIPLLIITPLAFLGGSFYSISMLPPFWQKVSLLNPVVYLISGFRWSFYGRADVSILTSFIMIGIFLAICMGIVNWMFKTGYGLKK